MVWVDHMVGMLEVLIVRRWEEFSQEDFLYLYKLIWPKYFVFFVITLKKDIMASNNV